MNYMTLYLLIAVPFSLITTLYAITKGVISFINLTENIALTNYEYYQLVINILLLTFIGFIMGVLYPFCILYSYYVYMLYFITK